MVHGRSEFVVDLVDRFDALDAHTKIDLGAVTSPEIQIDVGRVESVGHWIKNYVANCQLRFA